MNSTRVGRALPGPGLTAPGVLILQTLLILLVETGEYALGKIGTLTGLALLLAIGGGIYLGRTGTAFITAVAPPLALLFTTILVLCTVGGRGFHLARLGVDLITTLAALAPYLATCAVVSWGNYALKARATRKESIE